MCADCVSQTLMTNYLSQLGEKLLKSIRVNFQCVTSSIVSISMINFTGDPETLIRVQQRRPPKSYHEMLTLLQYDYVSV